MPAMDVESAQSRPSFHPLPCTTTRRCASGSSLRNQPQALTASGRGGDGSHGGSTRATPKKKDSKAHTANSKGSSTQPASQMVPHCSRWEMSRHHKSHKDLKKDSSGDKKKKKKKDPIPARKSSGHKAHKDGGWC